MGQKLRLLNLLVFFFLLFASAAAGLSPRFVAASRLYFPVVGFRAALLSTSTPTPGPTIQPTITPWPPPTGKVEIIGIHAIGTGSREPDEWVAIRNTDTHDIQLQGWTLSDLAHHVYTFPPSEIYPGQTCRIYTNETHPEWCGFSYGSSSPIWSNDRGTAILRDAQGNLVDGYTYR